jgi:hypothetical protein
MGCMLCVKQIPAVQALQENTKKNLTADFRIVFGSDSMISDFFHKYFKIFGVNGFCCVN